MIIEILVYLQFVCVGLLALSIIAIRRGWKGEAWSLIAFGSAAGIVVLGTIAFYGPIFGLDYPSWKR